MSDVAEEIRRAIKGELPPHGDAPPSSLRGQPDEEFMKLRAHVFGTLLYAHRQLSGDEFSVVDDRVISAVMNWMESKRSK